MTGPSTGLVASLDVAGRLRADVRAAAGSVVAVIGPNGAGKSTLLGALAGVVPTAGSVEVEGRSWTAPPLSLQERGVGWVFQDQSLFPHLSAVDNVAFGLRVRGTRREPARAEAREWLDRFGIGELAGRRPRELSGGQAQRVAIARALVTDPVLLLLDEPFAGLDVGIATTLRIELARHLAEYRGVTLLVTHDALDALTLADTVWVLEDGAVVQQGTPREVAAQPRSDHVARLVGLNVIADGAGYRAFAPSAVLVATEPSGGSARNRWTGVVVGVVTHAGQVRLTVEAAGPDGADLGTPLIADVTPQSAVELGLVSGRAVWLSVKETAITSYT